MSRLNPQFFPKDLSYLSYIDVWLPEDAPLSATNAIAHKAEAVIREVAERFGRSTTRRTSCKALTTFVGGGGPAVLVLGRSRAQQLNYAQIIIEVNDKHFTNELVGPLQTALSREVPGRADRRPAARDGQAGRDPDLDPHLGRRHGGPAPTLRASCRRSSARSPGRAGSATTGASPR